jgi:hypothetical protein
MLEALWIVLTRMVIIMAVMGVLYLGIIILNKLVRPSTKEKKEE